ncbi:MAG: hypothetical protein HOV79_09120 [Hamadaea sp.]|nr:hypothetical protein [Hamadaea sp.]
MTPLVSDDVWARLDRNAGRMSRRGLRMLLAAALALGIAAVLVMLGWRTAVTPVELDWRAGADAEGHPNPTRFWQGFTLRNGGLLPVTVTGFGGETTGLRYTGTQQDPLPLRIEPSESVYVRISYDVTACDTVPAEPMPIQVTVARPWGEQTVPVVPVSFGDHGWQHAMAEMACHPDRR